MNRKLIARGYDAKGRDYEVYDYGATGWSSKTINRLPSSGKAYRYVCFYCGGRVFTCGDDLDEVLNTTRDATERSQFYGSWGRFSMVV